jgi:hypothetical protein
MSIICARNPSTIKEIKKVKTPKATDTHTPIPHLLLIEKARKAIKESGLRILDEEHALARGGLRYFGGFSVEGDDMQSDERRLVIGLRNSHDKAFAAAICVGNQMMVCDNLCFSSDEKLARRHTKNILRDLDRVMASAIARVKSHWLNMEQRIDAYKSLAISRAHAADLLTSLVDAKAFTARDLYAAIKEFEQPRHESFNGGTLWTLYNAVTENLKQSNLSLLPHRTMTMQSIFDAVVKFAPDIRDAAPETVQELNTIDI